ncbi:MAG: hypothetical protein GOMPHAMPRED_001322 [Gomphillus americanus]|uniref:PLD phosphodiesterase domain-containing protein n=1 Tax=Gomphillus americanus TaxID=1940652 RepID=A0A8H3IE99_9LECA|nr:MAG: hypothetical protein GOMPHAMPRED_001322 [Gomphillus americanus]
MLGDESSSLLNKSFHDLTSDSTIEDFCIGTGHTIFEATLLPAILSAQYEIVLATCFWAPGPTLESLNLALKQLSTRVIASSSQRKIKVNICLSSRSLFQKLFHTASKHGYTYPPDSWKSKLGLPSPEKIPGLQLTIKSLFFRPFSVLHSKYLIIDRRDVWLPSCNVSWEEWYECCVHLRGQVVNHVFAFWLDVWSSPDEAFDTVPQTSSTSDIPLQATYPEPHSSHKTSFTTSPIIPTTLLPHPHNASIRHSLWFLPPRLTPPPQTPLNTTLLHLFNHAQKSITILTPNFTSPPVYIALLTAISRGVNIHLITNRRMMILEQLLTSGSITERWLWRLKRAYKGLLLPRQQQSPSNEASALESARPGIGSLRIDIFSPPTGTSGAASAQVTREDLEAGLVGQAAAAAATTKVHIKLTMIDDEIVVLGSGNMDRASWYTSQELGVMLRGGDVVRRMWSDVQAGLEGCLERYV